MKKTFIVPALLLALCLVFAACGAPGASQPEDSSQPAGSSRPASSLAQAPSEPASQPDATAEDIGVIIQQARTSMPALESVDYRCIIDMDMEMMGERMAMATTMDMSMTADPLRMKMLTTMDVMGQVTQSEVYMEQQGNMLVMYTMVDGEWVEESYEMPADMDGQDIQSGVGVADIDAYLAGLGDARVVGTELVNGAECYRIEGTLTGDAAAAALAQSGGTGTLAEMGVDPAALAASFNVPVAMLVDKETFAVVTLDADMAATMEALYTQIFSALDTSSLGDVDLTVKVHACTMRLEYTNFNTVATIEMPQGITA